MEKLRVDVWSDIACPWCYIGKRRFEKALASFDKPVELVWRSFELDPGAPRVRDDVPQALRLARKYRVPLEQAQMMIDRVVKLATEEGLDFQYDRMRGGNTFDSHRLLHLAHERGLQSALKERLLRGYFSEGVAIGEPDAIAPLAVEAGLAEAEVREVLAGDRYTDAVRRDEQLAAELGIRGVPFFVIAGRIGVSGAQAPDVLLGALERGWQERAGEDVVDGATCGPDGCA